MLCSKHVSPRYLVLSIYPHDARDGWCSWDGSYSSCLPSLFLMFLSLTVVWSAKAQIARAGWVNFGARSVFARAWDLQGMIWFHGAHTIQVRWPGNLRQWDENYLTPILVRLLWCWFWWSWTVLSHHAISLQKSPCMLVLTTLGFLITGLFP